MTEADRIRILRFGVLDCLLDGRSISDTCDKLSGYDPAEVAQHYRRVKAQRALAGGDRREERAAAVQRVTRRPRKQHGERGITVAELAAQAGVPRVVMVRSLEHAGLLRLVYVGRDKRRHLTTREAERDGIGFDVDPAAKHSPRLSGYGKSAMFPVFKRAAVPAILARLDLGGIRAGILAQPTKRTRIAWALDHACHLPSAFLAEICGVTIRAVEKARARRSAGESSVVGYLGVPDAEPPTPEADLEMADTD